MIHCRVIIPGLNDEDYSFVEVMGMPHTPTKRQKQKGLSMANVIRMQPPTRVASAFLMRASRPLLRPDVWTEAGQAIETAHRSPLLVGRVARLSGVLWMAAMAKLLAW